MLTNVIHDLFAYTDWANARVLDAAASLSQEAFARDMGSSFPSVRATLVHVLGAEWIWLTRWNGASPPGMPAEWTLETVEDVRDRWGTVAADRQRFLLTLDDAALGRVLEYRTMRGEPFRAPLFELMLHAVNHSTYHRGQVVTLLRQLGTAATGTDFVLYHRELERTS